MNKEILLVVEAICNEKGLAKEAIFQAVESALAMATKKGKIADIDVRVAIDRETGDYSTFRRWSVVSDDQSLDNPATQMRLSIARDRNPLVEVGNYVEEPMESMPFGRIGAQAAKQVIVQKVREAERAQLFESYQRRVGQLITGVVKRIDRNGIILDLGNNAEASIDRSELIPREAIRNGDRVRGYLKEVRSENRGPQLLVTRTAPELLIELFKLEVPEAGEGLIEIMGASRDPGLRAKIAVYSRETRVDSVGACVGMRGSRVQAVSNELSGERIDIIPWDANPAQFVINAMSPAEVTSIMVDEDSHSMDVAVPEAQLAQAIGRNGQNVRLASQLTGWELNVMTETQAVEKNEQETQNLQQLFMDALEVDSDLAAILVQEGFSTLEEVAYVPVHEMLQIEGIEQELVEELRNRARDILLTRAIVSEEHVEPEPSSELLAMEGMDLDLARILATRGITTMDELAELAVDDLTDIEGVNQECAASLIMAARAPWFARQDQA